MTIDKSMQCSDAAVRSRREGNVKGLAAAAVERVRKLPVTHPNTRKGDRDEEETKTKTLGVKMPAQ